MVILPCAAVLSSDIQAKINCCCRTAVPPFLQAHRSNKMPTWILAAAMINARCGDKSPHGRSQGQLSAALPFAKLGFFEAKFVIRAPLEAAWKHQESTVHLRASLINPEQMSHFTMWRPVSTRTSGDFAMCCCPVIRLKAKSIVAVELLFHLSC